MVRPRTYAVGAVAIDDRDRVLLVGQYRYTLGHHPVLARQLHVRRDGSSYLATGLTRGESDPDETEELQVRWSLLEAVEAARTGELFDAMTQIGLLRIALDRAEASGGDASDGAPSLVRVHRRVGS